jgi:hypothetical protein
MDAICSTEKRIFPEIHGGAGIAQLAHQLARGWTTEESEFESRIFLLHVVQTVSGAQPASYTMDTGRKAAWA